MLNVTQSQSPAEQAATAVVGSIRPSWRDRIVDRHPWPGGDPDSIAVAVLVEHMQTVVPEHERAFWRSTGVLLTDSLCDVTGVKRAVASHMVMGSWHAHRVAGADVTGDGVLRTAERATVWLQGFLVGVGVAGVVDRTTVKAT